MSIITVKKGENPNIPKMATILPAECAPNISITPKVTEAFKQLYTGGPYDAEVLKNIKDTLSGLSEEDYKKFVAAFAKGESDVVKKIAEYTGISIN